MQATSQMDRIERLRIRRHMLQTKGGTLTPGEQYWLRYLNDILSPVIPGEEMPHE